MKILTFLLSVLLFSCTVKNDKPAASPITLVKVVYTNGDTETISIPTYPSKIYFREDFGTGILLFLPVGNQVIRETAATDVRRFEIISSNYK